MMKRMIRTLTRLLVAGVLLAPGPAALGQEGPKPDAAMEAMRRAATPNEHHGHLAAREGTWKAEGKLWTTPGQPPVETSGVIKNTMILGGRFLQSEYEGGEFRGMKMAGMGVEGYDVDQEKYVSMWVDSLETMMTISEGHCEDDGKVLTLTTDFVDPATGKTVKMRMVTTMQGPDKHTFESYYVIPDGEPMKNMEIVYTRM